MWLAGLFFLGSCVVMGVALGVGLAVDKRNALLQRKEQKLLGPASKQTVIQRLRKMGFTVVEKYTTPRKHMLGWLYVCMATNYKSTCPFCQCGFHELREVCEDKNQSGEGALMVFWVRGGYFCDICGFIDNESRKSSGDGGRKRVVNISGSFSGLIYDARAGNLFEILDHLQSQSGKMDDTIADWLAARKKLLEREAAKIGEALSRHQLYEAEDVVGDGPFREMELPELDDVPKMLKKRGDKDKNDKESG